MKLIIGLGNPGEKYLQTRHNVAWIIFDKLLPNADWEKSKHAQTLYYKDTILENDVEYLKPTTFMNDSGIPAAYAINKHDISPEDIIVIHDDIDLPIGQIKISFDRGDGGHNGVKSIFEHIKTKKIVRIRVGVSIVDDTGILRKPDVLGNFSKEELDILKDNISPLVSDILTTIVSTGYEKAMTKYN